MSSLFALSNEALGEVVSYLPELADKHVFELDGHCGQLPSQLASAVTAIQLDHDGVLNPAIGTFSADLIVSVSGAFSQLSNQKALATLSCVLNAMKEGGKFFLLECCYAVRKPIEYAILIEQATDNGYGFEVERASLLKTAVQQGNFDIVWWMIRKVAISSDRVKAPNTNADQHFLDGGQYSLPGILQYERIFGLDYVSTGGESSTRHFCEMLPTLTTHKDTDYTVQVLDVGCGTGGSAFFLKKEYGAYTVGVDLSVHMISIAFEKQREKRCGGVQFLVADATKMDFEEEQFDLIYSRDSILYIHDKPALFKNFFKWLKPGGEVSISDYCGTDTREWSADFNQYLAQRGFHVLSLNKYAAVLREAGFSQVRAIDNTHLFISNMRRELEKFIADKETFMRDFTQYDFDSMVELWNDKIRRCEQTKEHIWGNFYAKKL